MLSLLAAALFAVAIPALPADGVADSAGLLSRAERVDLASRIAVERQQDGAQFYVLTLRESDRENPRDLAMRALGVWGAPDRSVVFLVLMDQRQVRIQPGPGLAGDLSGPVADAIYAHAMATPLRAGRFAEALRFGIESVRVQVRHEAPVSDAAQTVVHVTSAPPEAHTAATDVGWGAGAWLLALGLLAGAAYLALRAWRRWRGGEEGRWQAARAEPGLTREPPQPAVQSVPPVRSMKPEPSPLRRTYEPPRTSRAVTHQTTVVAPVVVNNPAPYQPSPPAAPAWPSSSPSSSWDSGSSSSSSSGWGSGDSGSSGGGGSFDIGGGGGGFDSGGGGGGFDGGGGGGSF
jgi:uncharacterized membrane protein YgcG